MEADGSLMIPISNQAPADKTNGLATRSGLCYLILHRFHPSADFIGGQVGHPCRAPQQLRGTC